MRKKIAIEMLDWTLINFVTPLVLPLLFALCVSLFYVRVDMNVYQLFTLLLKNGVYTFLGLTILISLFQDYRTTPQAFTLPLYVGVLFSFFVIGFVFLSSLGFVPKENAISYEENINAFAITTTSILTLSLWFKYDILRKKHKKK
ncbi:hypothetical protein AGMMS49982_07820 [Bacteroidia bacterium]|nr:hypothetical protein AGMMS49982_07820 [Bacteroidia bacterium]